MLLQSLNIAHRFPSIVWDTACLAVSSAANNENSDKQANTDYATIAASIGKMQKHGTKVSLPDINKSRYSFYPDIENNQILYGLKGITNVNDNVANVIRDNRPYTSFEDFYNRIYKTKLIQTSHMVQLIKAGCFDEFGDRVLTMRDFLIKEVNVKESLTFQNMKACLNYNIIPSDFQYQITLYDFYTNYLKKQIKKVNTTKPKDVHYHLPKYDEEFYLNNFTQETIVEANDESLIISDKALKKEYDKLMLPLKEWLATHEAATAFNNAQFRELWNKHAQGSISKWEMQSVSYYSSGHELAGVNSGMYNISNFFEIDTNPVVTSTYKRGGREYQNYEIFTLVGTVLDKNKNKHSFTLLTPTGVVTCKTYAGSFANYDKAITLPNGTKEKSWFSRGNLLMVRGFRRDDQFVLRTYNSQGYKPSTISLITNVNDDGTIELKSKRG